MRFHWLNLAMLFLVIGMCIILYWLKVFFNVLIDFSRHLGGIYTILIDVLKIMREQGYRMGGYDDKLMNKEEYDELIKKGDSIKNNEFWKGGD